MASTRREFSFCDKDQNNGIVRALYNQKYLSNFCDVIMKVCGREIFAHSNVLAAASPYFSSFLSHDLPRQFSQRSPQIIEIQIDGNEPNVLYEEAVSAVIDFIYTGDMVIKDTNVSQVCEIARIMQMDNIVAFCGDVAAGRDPQQVSRDEVNITKVDASTETSESDFSLLDFPIEQKHFIKSKLHSKPPDSAFQAKIKAKQLVSTSSQVYPHMLPELGKDHANLQDQATSTDSRYFESILSLSKHIPSKRTYSHIKKKPRQTPATKKTLRYILYSPEITPADKENTFENVESEHYDKVGSEQEIFGKVTDEIAELYDGQDPTDGLEPTNEVTGEHGEESFGTIPENPTQGEVYLQMATNPVKENQVLIQDDQETVSVIFPEVTEQESNQESNQEPNQGSNEQSAEHADSAQVNIGATPRRSSRVSKPTAKLQEFQAVKTCGSPVKEPLIKRIKLEVPEEAIYRDDECDDGREGDDYEAQNYWEKQRIKEEHTKEVEAAERLLSLADHIVQKECFNDGERDFVVEEITHIQGSEGHLAVQEAMEEVLEISSEAVTPERRKDYASRRKYTARKPSPGTNIQIGPGKYQCESCSFNTNKVREMSAHIKLHKLENNICYYCEDTFDNKEVLTQHMDKHKGPNPFFCHVCMMRFKSRTLLNMHLPKHSDSKPYICEVCCAGFKWKHALKCHMITHSNKKEHLCDICGFATAHKSQLKAHRKIHTGDTYKCDHDGCTFEATKIQNLKYHFLTHTKEKPHQCDICGQNFSLVKNLRRHMLLHTTTKKQACMHCTFCSTRMDKLKEHMLKIHGVGTPPERRVRVTDLVLQNMQNQFRTPMNLVSIAEEEEVQDSEGMSYVKSEVQQTIEISQDTEIEPVTTEIVELSQENGTIQQIANIAQSLPTDAGETTTLIEIVPEGGVQPIQIFPDQSILITQGGQEGTVLHEGQLAEVVQISGLPGGQSIVLTEHGSHAAAAGTITSDDIIMASGSGTGLSDVTLMVPHDVQELVRPGDAAIKMDSGPIVMDTVTAAQYAGLVEVPVSVASFVNTVSSN